MASASITKLARTAESSRRALANIRNKAKARANYAVSNGEVILGGCLGGVVDGALGEGGADAELFGMPANAIIGAALLAAGMSDFKGAEHAGYTGAGVLAYMGGNYTREQFA